MENKKIIFGRQAILEAVKSSITISKVIIHKSINRKSSEKLIPLLEKNKIPFSYVPVQKLNKLIEEKRDYSQKRGK